nr:RNA polymerase sporulation sigma factor SigK [uncultured Blautia sp.]
MKTFQKPLTPEEESRYLQEYKQGSLQAKDILIERNLRLVAHIVKKYQGAPEELDDLISIGTIGLIKAVQTFDAKKASRLSTYAARCIDNELLMYFRSKKKINREVSLYDPIGTDKEGNEISLLDVIETEPVDVVKNYSLRQDSLLLYRLIPQILTQREQEIIKFRYGLYGQQEQTQREIAKRLNISRSYVSRIEKNALMKLRSFFPAS